ncbi:hypothetical protein BZA77DRAFT_106026 [Pyronema omphalodes]|nr:hypothetical protein BZA77DRAFT_106026 [Pyronema omphalodes]
MSCMYVMTPHLAQDRSNVTPQISAGGAWIMDIENGYGYGYGYWIWIWIWIWIWRVGKLISFVISCLGLWFFSFACRGWFDVLIRYLRKE